MVLPIIPTSARALFRVAVPNFFKQGLSMNAMIREAKVFGISYQRQAMLTDIRSILNLVKGEALTKNVSRSETFPDNKMMQGILNRDRKYWIHGVATYQDTESGQTFQSFVSMYSDKKRSLDNWSKEFMRGWDAEEYDYSVNLLAVDFRVVEHNEGYGY